MSGLLQSGAAAAVGARAQPPGCDLLFTFLLSCFYRNSTDDFGLHLAELLQRFIFLLLSIEGSSDYLFSVYVFLASVSLFVYQYRAVRHRYARDARCIVGQLHSWLEL